MKVSSVLNRHFQPVGPPWLLRSQLLRINRAAPKHLTQDFNPSTLHPEAGPFGASTILLRSARMDFTADPETVWFAGLKSKIGPSAKPRSAQFASRDHDAR